MNGNNTRPVVAVVNGEDEVLDFVKNYLEMEGYAVVTAHEDDFKDEKYQAEHFFDEHQVGIVFWDVVHPYAEHYDFYKQRIQKSIGAGRCVVMTCTGEPDLRKLAEGEPNLKILAKPYTLEDLLREVKRCEEEITIRGEREVG